MIAEPPVKKPSAKPPFPLAKVEEILRRELKEAADDSVFLQGGGWEPALDSLTVVTVLTELEDLFPFKLPPEKVVRKGGYKSVEEGVKDVKEKLRELWNKHHNK